MTGPGHLHVSGYVLLDNASRPAGLAALRRAMAMGQTTSVGPQSAPHLAAAGAGAGAGNFLRWVDGVDLLLPNDSELEALGGAGDAFTAGLLACWLRGDGPESALRQGVAAGSAAAARVGARPAGSRPPGGPR